MRRTASAVPVGLLLLVGVGLDSGLDGVTNMLLWGVAFANFYLTGCLIGWLLARLTPTWQPPSFVSKWFDFLTPPGDRREDIGA